MIQEADKTADKHKPRGWGQEGCVSQTKRTTRSGHTQTGTNKNEADAHEPGGQQEGGLASANQRAEEGESRCQWTRRTMREMVCMHKSGASKKEVQCTQTRMWVSKRASECKPGGWGDGEKMGRTMGGEAGVHEPGQVRRRSNAHKLGGEQVRGPVDTNQGAGEMESKVYTNRKNYRRRGRCTQTRRQVRGRCSSSGVVSEVSVGLRAAAKLGATATATVATATTVAAGSGAQGRWSGSSNNCTPAPTPPSAPSHLFWFESNSFYLWALLLSDIRPNHKANMTKCYDWGRKQRIYEFTKHLLLIERRSKNILKCQIWGWWLTKHTCLDLPMTDHKVEQAHEMWDERYTWCHKK